MELIVVRDDGVEESGEGLRGNVARGPTAPIIEIARGRALSAASPGDFFGVDLNPPAGGPGATVGYAADVAGTGKLIPPVEDVAGECGANEVLLLSFGGGEGFQRAEVNGDGKVNITDAVLVAESIFLSPPPVRCADALDVDDDGALNTADPVFLLTYIFLHGPRPAQPFGSCGIDPTGDSLGCEEPNCR